MDKRRAQALFSGLVRIPSLCCSPGEEAACRLLEEALDEYGIPHERISDDPARPNLLAFLPASRPSGEAPLVLISHIDVVDGTQEGWHFPPFSGESVDSRILGRGTLDTKQLTIMELAAFTALSKVQRIRDVYFLAAVDEETGSKYGMETVLRKRPQLFEHAYVINEGGGFPVFIDGKPFMTLTVGEKSVFRAKLSARGTGGHASVPTDDQAVVHLAFGLEKLFSGPCELKSGSRSVAQAIESIAVGRPLEGAAAMLHAYAGGSSLHLRDWRIGQRVNVLPSAAECVVELRSLPFTHADEAEAFFRERLRGTRCAYEMLAGEEGFESDPDDPLAKLLAFGARAAGHPMPVFPMLALGRTDGRFFGRYGSKVFGCSPCTPDDPFDRVLKMVHGPDESIAEASFHFGLSTLGYAVREFCTKRWAL